MTHASTLFIGRIKSLIVRVVRDQEGPKIDTEQCLRLLYKINLASYRPQ